MTQPNAENLRAMLDAIQQDPALQHEMRQLMLEFIRNDYDLRQELRKEILTEELLQLPTRFTQFEQTAGERFDKLEHRFDKLEQDVAGLKSDVANLKGSDLENRARRVILNIAMNELGLTRGRILLTPGRDTEPGFLDTINAAEQAGIITEQQADHVLVADIIIRARRADDRRFVHAVFEVSRTIKLDDIQRAHERATTVAAATGEPAIPAVVGEVIQPPQQHQADDMNVKVLLPPMLRQDQTGDETPTPWPRPEPP